MKYQITFTIPEETSEHETYMAAPRMASALVEMGEFLRTSVKYAVDDDPHTPGLEKAREKFWEIVNDNGIADVV